MARLCELPYRDITRERVLNALAHKGFKKKGEFEHELRVVYELVQGNKLHKERLKVRVFSHGSTRTVVTWREFLGKCRGADPARLAVCRAVVCVCCIWVQFGVVSNGT